MTEQTPYGQNPAAPAAAVPTRPPLTAAQKRGAMLAGGIGFTLMTFGFSLVGAVVVVAVIAAVITGIAGIVERSGESTEGFMEWFSTVVSDFGWVLVVVAVVGVLIWVAGYITSVRILKSSGNERAVGITWSALGIGIVASWIIGSVLSIPAQLSGVVDDFDRGIGQASVIVSLLSGVVGIATTIAVGIFSWWWMAHALRRPAAAPLTASPAEPHL